MPRTLNHIRLRNQTGTIDRRFRVLRSGFDPKIMREDSVEPTVTGGADIQIGPRWREFSMVLKVRQTETVSDYGNLSELQSFFESTTPTNYIVQYYDNHDANDDDIGDLYNVVILNEWSPEMLTHSRTGQEAWHMVPVVLRSV